MAETVNQGNTNTNGQGNQAAGGSGERTFTQAELDTVISERLNRERAKYADYETLKDKAAKFDAAEEASKTELQKAQDERQRYKDELDRIKNENKIRDIRGKVSQETGVPENLLSGDTEEICKEQAKAILAFANQGSYPDVRDGGEPGKVSKKTTRDQFADFFNQF